MNCATALTSKQAPQTLFAKVWQNHEVAAQTSQTPAVLYIDLHLLHEVTSPQAFQFLRERGLKVHAPTRTMATADHSIPTLAAARGAPVPFVDAQTARQVAVLGQNCREFGIQHYGIGHAKQGIVHVIGPELGLTQPGKTIVCGDSHTSTHGAFGALAFGIGTSEVGHVLATQALLQRRPKTFGVRVTGHLQRGVGAKDLILAIIQRIGTAGGTGHVFEFTGSAITALSMDERMTVCNMAIEAGAKAGMIAPDDHTFEFLEGREFTPRGRDWEVAVRKWRGLASDDGATFDQELEIDASSLEPMITYGTSPEMAMGIRQAVPAHGADGSLTKALAYMQFKPGETLLGKPVNVVFIGSCTNSRLSDLRAAASILAGRKVAPGVRALIVPGSQPIKKAAEREGLAAIFRHAGAEWREPGCSMCIAMNGDQLHPGELAVSTSNRNFEGRQGQGSRTMLASPLTAAAAAVAGAITDPRVFLE